MFSNSAQSSSVPLKQKGAGDANQNTNVGSFLNSRMLKLSILSQGIDKAQNTLNSDSKDCSRLNTSYCGKTDCLKTGSISKSCLTSFNGISEESVCKTSAKAACLDSFANEVSKIVEYKARIFNTDLKQDNAPDGYDLNSFERYSNYEDESNNPDNFWKNKNDSDRSEPEEDSSIYNQIRTSLSELKNKTMDGFHSYYTRISSESYEAQNIPLYSIHQPIAPVKNIEEILSTVNALNFLDPSYAANIAPQMVRKPKALNSNILDVLQLDRFGPKLYKDMSINGCQAEVIANLKKYRVSLILGPTGCGKTLQVPVMLLIDHLSKAPNKPFNIVIAQPRRIAAVSAARSLSRIQGSEGAWQIGEGLLGYHIGRDFAAKDTHITYVTCGILLKKLINDRCLDGYTHIIIDEAHERDYEMDMLLMLTRTLQLKTRTSCKIIVMSATMDVSLIADYFSVNNRDILGDEGESDPDRFITCVPYGDKRFNVRKITLASIKEFLIKENVCDLTAWDKNFVGDLSHERMYLPQSRIDISIWLLHTIHEVKPMDELIIAFLPGMAEIRRFEQAAVEFAESRGYNWEIVVLHSSVSVEDQQKVYSDVPAGCRRIIAATNIAESSLTIPGLSHVLDFGMHKRLSCGGNGLSFLRLELMSKASGMQRMGRVGRQKKGSYWLFLTDAEEAGLPVFSPSEISSLSLNKLILEVKVLGLQNHPALLLSLLPEPPNKQDVYRSILELKRFGALTKSVDSNGDDIEITDGDITNIGMALEKFPMDLRLSLLVLYGNVFGVLEQSIILASAIMIQSVFRESQKNKIGDYLRNLRIDDGLFSDPLICFKVYHEYVKHGKDFEELIRRGGEDYKTVSWYRLREMDELVVYFRQRILSSEDMFEDVNIEQKLTEEEEMFLLKLTMAAAFFPQYAVQDVLQDRDLYKKTCGVNLKNTVTIDNEASDETILYDHQFRKFLNQAKSLQGKAYFANKNFEISHYRNKIIIQFAASPPRNSTMGVCEEVLVSIAYGLKNNIRLKPLQLDKKYLSEHLKLNTSRDDQRPSSHYYSMWHRNKRECSKCKLHQEHHCPIVTEPAICDTGSKLKVLVTFIRHCDEIWGINKKNFEQLIFICETLEKGQLKSFSRRGTEAIGCVCIALLSHMSEERLMRVQITGIERGRFKVFALDYGFYGRCECEMYELPEELKAVPALAMKLAMYRVYVCEEDGANALEYLNNKLIGKVVRVKVEAVVENMLQATFYNNTRESYNEILHKKGFVYLHAETPDIRTANQPFYTDKPDLFIDKHIFEHSTGFQQARNVRILSNAELDRAVTGCLKGGDISYIGPNSPVRCTWKGLAKQISGKEISFDGASVLSVSVDPNPYLPFDRVIVSPSCRAGQKVICFENSTMMSRIPGMLGLLAMLFSPSVFLKYKEGQLYGALTGVGCDKNGNAVYDEGDLEIIFDTQFDEKDIKEINFVRNVFNEALLASCEGGQLNVDNCMTEHRTLIFEHILPLFNKKRDLRYDSLAWEKKKSGSAVKYRWEWKECGQKFNVGKTFIKNNLPLDKIMLKPVLSSCNDNDDGLHNVDISEVSHELEDLKTTSGMRVAGLKMSLQEQETQFEEMFNDLKF